MSVRIATYNIQFGVGQDQQYRLERIISAIQNQDIICLQEVTTNWQLCQMDNQPGILADALNLYQCYASAFEIDTSYKDDKNRIVNRRYTFGNMVLSKWPILYSRTHSLPRPATPIPDELFPCIDFPRCLLETVILVESTPIRVLCVHLTHIPGPQTLAQATALKSISNSITTETPLWQLHPDILAWTEGRHPPPVPSGSLILGDFNFEPNTPEYTLITDKNDGFVDAWRLLNRDLPHPATCLEPNGGQLQLDYVFLSKELSQTLKSIKVDQNNKSSDHYPIYTEFDFTR